ncbi:hypothetical protein KR084_010650, partial [Drosophila pseudotakahashii]
RFEFTNFICKSFDKQFGEFEYCYLKSVNRTYKYISGKFKLYQLPITKLRINFSIWKRYNGYKPFMYNVTMNACKFLKNPSTNPVAKFVFESFSMYTNMNHLCPYNHDLILEKLPTDFINQRLTEVLPFPEGDYRIDFYWLYLDLHVLMVKVYLTLS